MTKPDKLSIEECEIFLKALHTQYQFCADAIIPRRSQDAPTICQISDVRKAHLSIIPIIKQLADTMRENERLHDIIKEIRDTTPMVAQRKYIDTHLKFLDQSNKESHDGK